MLALLLRRIVGAELLLYGIGSVLLWRTDTTLIDIVLTVLVIAIAWRTGVVLFTFILAGWYRSPPTTVLSRTPVAWLMAFGSEWVAFTALYTVLQPFEARSQPFVERFQRHVPVVPVQRGRPVLLIHGFCCNAAYWWAMQRFLRAGGINPLFTITLEPILGKIDDYATQVAQYVEQICVKTGAQQVILVGHSMGGLVARAYIQQGGSARVAKLITLGSPHHGSVLTRFSPLRGSNVQQIMPSSEWLTWLNDNEATLLSPVPITSIYSEQDNLVAPQTSSCLPYPHVKNIALSGIGHLALSFSPQVQRCVYDEITDTF